MKPFEGWCTVGWSSTTPLLSTFLLFLFGHFSARHYIVWSVTWFTLVKILTFYLLWNDKLCCHKLIWCVEWSPGPKCGVITKTQRASCLWIMHPAVRVQGCQPAVTESRFIRHFTVRAELQTPSNRQRMSPTAVHNQKYWQDVLQVSPSHLCTLYGLEFFFF